MSYNEAETRFYLIDPVLRAKGFDEHWKLRLETPAPVEPVGNKGRRRPGSGRTDYLLCVQVGDTWHIEAQCNGYRRRCATFLRTRFEQRQFR